MGLTNIGLLENTIKCYKNSNYYIYGTFGQKLTLSLVESKIKQYPKFYRTAERIRNAKNAVGRYKYAYDCVGLIKCYLFGGFGNVKYKSKYDLSANGMYNKCTEKGKIKNIPNIKGLLVWMDGHIGVYDGEKYSYECTVSGGTFRIIKTVAKTRGWTNWGKCAYIKYEDDKKEEKKKFKKYYIKVTVNRLNVREGAGTNYKAIKTIKKGEKWLIRDEKNGWGKIRIGWIKLSYTKRV
jgi:hypothetical protein